MKEYRNLTVAELRKLARERGIKGYSRMRKAQLVAALEKEDAVPKSRAAKATGPSRNRASVRESDGSSVVAVMGASAQGARSKVGSRGGEYGKPHEKKDREQRLAQPVEPKVTELPVCYGEDRLVVVPRDPSWVFVYWEITEGTYRRANREVGGGRLVLRLWLRNGLTGSRLMEFDVPEGGTKYYAQVNGDHSFVVGEIGMIGPRGDYCALARSKEVEIPRSKIQEASPTFVTVPFEIPLSELREKGRISGTVNVSQDGRLLTEEEYRRLYEGSERAASSSHPR